MLFRLLLLFTLVPLGELALLIWIGNQIGLVATVSLVLVTGVVGAALARWQGFQILGRIQEEMRAGRMPADALVDGLLILVAGAFLVTPGVLTDLVGFSLLVPPVRRTLKRQVAAWLRRHADVRTVHYGATTHGDGASANRGDQIIDVEVIKTRVEDAN